MPADPNRVESVFARALELPAADRPAFVAVECGPDAEALARVERLLAAHEELGDPPTATFGDLAPTADHPDRDAPDPPGAGTVIAGKYKLVEEIGEGGMGSVWMAQQTEPVRRFVAVKLIKAGMDSKAVLARFEAERQALALMDHPNIAKVLDAGATPDGRPFFVMELVKGVPITKFCDERKLTPRERLELFVPVCQAIQHAHQKGVIHRDIKPSNVLVALYDDKPVPKVIDFGVAKAAGQQLTDRTLATGFGAIVGTPEYMSPEQASFNNLDIDTRSDVYSLGVLLYELLAGSPPFSRKELDKAGLLEILRIVREVEPPRPSAKLSTADALPTLSANRGTEPKKLTGLLRSELDWIVMKALEKDRTRRYETATGFAADAQRYLGGEAVQAHPPSAGYRLKKFARRNKGWLGAVAAFASVLLVAAGAVWSVQSRADRERAAADADRVAREAGTAASVQEATREARERAEEAWGLSGYPDRMHQESDAAAAAARRAEGFLAAGAATDAARAEVASARQTVDELARHTRLIDDWAANQRRFADELDAVGDGGGPRGKLAGRHADALRRFGLDPFGDADRVARVVASDRLRDALLGILLELHYHAAYLPWVPPTSPTDLSPSDRLAAAIRSTRMLCGGAYRRWQELLDLRDVAGLVAFVASPDGLGFGPTLLSALGRDLASFNQHAACQTFLRTAVTRYPHDAWLRHDLVLTCKAAQPAAWAEGLLHSAAASALMPECKLFHLRIAECSAALRAGPQADAAYSRWAELRPAGGGAVDPVSAARERAIREAEQAADLLGMQGKWERVSTTEGSPGREVARAVKEVRGGRETVTFYGKGDEISYSHGVAINLARSGSVRTLTYSDMEILHGPHKGQKTGQTGSYVYALAGDTLYEVNGVLGGERTQVPSLGVWKRIREK